MENLQSIITNTNIDMTHKYINTLEDFQKILEEEYPNHNLKENDSKFISLSIVRNYLNAIEFNKILSTNMNAFISITKLNLTANDLISIPVEINQLRNLECLNLNNNKIKTISNLDNLINLKRLELRLNKIEKIENLQNNINLQLMTLSSNLICDIAEKDFCYLGNLKEFGLFGNYLGKIKNIIVGDKDNEEENMKKLLDLLCLFKNNIPNVNVLYLGGNYFSKLPNFRNLVTSYLKNLTCLDGL